MSAISSCLCMHVCIQIRARRLIERKRKARSFINITWTWFNMCQVHVWAHMPHSDMCTHTRIPIRIREPAAAKPKVGQPNDGKPFLWRMCAHVHQCVSVCMWCTVCIYKHRLKHTILTVNSWKKSIPHREMISACLWIMICAFVCRSQDLYAFGS